MQIEHCDLLIAYGHLYLAWNEPAAPPPGGARGELPVGPDDAIELLVFLAKDPEQPVSDMASSRLAAIPTAELVSALNSPRAATSARDAAPG